MTLAQTSELEQAIEWLSLRFRVPRDWEIVRHGIAPEKGSLVFVDRRRERLNVSWTDAATKPDLEHLLGDFRQRERQRAGGVASEIWRREPGWLGFSHPGDSGELVTRSVRYDAEARRLIECLVVTYPDEAQGESLLDALLDAFDVSGSAETATALSAFDVRVTVPKHFRLVATSIKPAAVRFDFERSAQAGQRVPSRVSVRRLGMARAWFDGDAEALLRSTDPDVVYATFRRGTHAAHAATFAEGRARGPRLYRALGRLADCRAVLWACESKNALYQLATRGPRGALLEPAELSVRCCEGAPRG